MGRTASTEPQCLYMGALYRTVFRLKPALTLVTLKMEAEGPCTAERVQKTVICAVRSFRYVQHKLVPITTAWCVLGLRLEERPPIWWIAAELLNKQSRTADKGWSSSLGVWAKC